MIRLRRLRENEVLRNMVRETQISKSDLVYPVFIKEGTNEKNPVDSMPGIYQYTLDRFDEELERIQAAGIPAILIFGIPEHKDEWYHTACGARDQEESTGTFDYRRCVPVRIYLPRTLRIGEGRKNTER